MAHLHILGICGYTTSGLALMAKDLGYFVTGSDEDAYPPNSTLLNRAGIDWHNFHDPKNLTEWGLPDLVIQGNQIREGNPELLEAVKRKIKIISDSEFFYGLTRRRQRIVVAGSHGKTTTAALTAWILAVAGRRPGFRLGTIVKNFKAAVRFGEGEEFVFEGDEYTTTFNDPRPKFFHFHPRFAIINNIDWDHPDVFKTRSTYFNLFKEYLVRAMPQDGLLVVNAEDHKVARIVQGATCRVVTFGLRKGDFQARKVLHQRQKTVFEIYRGDHFLGQVQTTLAGWHNVQNVLAAVGLTLELGIDFKKIKKAVETFRGTSRRFEVVGQVKGLTVIDDYAHHPSKVRATIAAAKLRFPAARLFVVFVPHTYSRTKTLLTEYLGAFGKADFVIITDIEPARERHLAKLIQAKELVERLKRRKKNVFYLPEQGRIIDFVKKNARRGDVVLCMSVGGFDDLVQNLVEALKI